MEALQNLGIDWKLFLAQAVNFLILLYILHRFAYKPMLRFLEDRSGRIEAGLKDAEAAKAKLESVTREEAEVLRRAREEAKALLASAEADAKKRDALREEETSQKVAGMLEAAEAAMADEKIKLMKEAQAEIADLVSQGVRKVLPEAIAEHRETVIRKRAAS